MGLSNKSIASLTWLLLVLLFVACGSEAKSLVENAPSPSVALSSTKALQTTDVHGAKPVVQRGQTVTPYTRPRSVPPIPVPTNLTFVSVVTVLDGDTIEIELDGKVERLQLIGFDAPDLVRRPEPCFALEARKRVEELLIGTTVRIGFDSGQDQRDHFGRLMAYIWMLDGELLNYIMILEGYGREHSYRGSYRYEKQFAAAQHEAQQHQRGKWHPDTCPG